MVTGNKLYTPTENFLKFGMRYERAVTLYLRTYR